MKYFEDFTAGETETIPGYRISAEAIMDFARQWDPQPTHLDPVAAQGAAFSGLIAPGVQLLAISVRQLVTRPQRIALIAAMGWDEVRFLAPVRPDDTLTLTRRCLEARPSRSQPDRGIVRNAITLSNQHDRPVLSFIDAILVACRPAQDGPGQPAA